MTTRVDIQRTAPAVARALKGLNAAAHDHAIEAGLSPTLIELVQVRASQINGCSFCSDVHGRTALEAGEPVGRLLDLPTWEESARFDPATRAALRLAEAVTHVSDGHLPDAVYDEAHHALTHEQIAAIVWITIGINASNRAVLAGPR